MNKIEAVPFGRTPMKSNIPENYTHVSGIYCENNAPMFLGFFDNVWISPPAVESPLSEGLSHPAEDLHSSRVLKSILAARIPAEQSAVVWDDEGSLP
jgi:hypothetical protein